MQRHHLNRHLYIEEQAYTTERYVIPFIETVRPIDRSMKILEIGCGEGGNMKPFLDKGCTVTGVDMSMRKISNAETFYKNHPYRHNLKLINENIYHVGDELGQYDVIILRDVLEHIHDHDKFMNYVKRFLKSDGHFFLGFPPWQNPFGGHQQVLKSKILSRLPYFHILPKPILKMILTLFADSKNIPGMLELVDTRITIERFKEIVEVENYIVLKNIFYFINPNYEIKFKLRPREQFKLISSIPYFRNYVITTCYYLLSKNDTLPINKV